MQGRFGVGYTVVFLNLSGRLYGRFRIQGSFKVDLELV